MLYGAGVVLVLNMANLFWRTVSLNVRSSGWRRESWMGRQGLNLMGGKISFSVKLLPDLPVSRDVSRCYIESNTLASIIFSPFQLSKSKLGGKARAESDGRKDKFFRKIAAWFTCIKRRVQMLYRVQHTGFKNLLIIPIGQVCVIDTISSQYWDIEGQ